MNNEKEKLEEILKKLEGVYKTTIDPKQKERVKSEIERIKQRLQAIKEFKSEEVLLENEPTEKKVEIKEEKEISREATIDSNEFPILSKIKIEKLHTISDDPEINEASTYLKVFETKYWIALSDFHLKLDYYHSKERDKFYNNFENCNRLLRDYIKNLDELERASTESYKERLKMMKLKIGRAFLISLTELMKMVNLFVSSLIKDYENNGNIILNPTDIIKFSELETENKEIEGLTVIEALKKVLSFTDEFLRKIKIPEEILSIKNKI